MTIRTGLLGYPLGHSVSPAMHNAAFEALGLDGRYAALPTPPERLAETVAGLRAAGYRGVNVTIPHKQAVMPLLDELSDAARAVGAVNTVVVGPAKADPVNSIHRLNTQRPLRAWESVSPTEPVNEIHRLKTQRPLRAWESASPAPEGALQVESNSPAPEGALHFQPSSPAPEGALQVESNSPAPEGALHFQPSSPAPEGALHFQPSSPAPEDALHFQPSSPAPEGALHFQPGISIPGLWGDNTDWLGFLHPLDAAGFDLAGKSALLLGAGGSARAVVYALLQRGLAHLTIWARTPSRAAELAHHAQILAPQLTVNHSPFTITHSPALIINTTPLGMWPHVDASPWPDDLPMPPSALVYDLVYRPERTRFLRQAEAAGCATQGGLAMLVVQGAAAFELWTGQKPPLEVMMAAARAALASS